ncbi:MAG: MmgE/PrpD family protein, partial [Chloroflexota bacterium]
MRFAQRLAQWVGEFDAASVTPRAQQQAKLLLLDSLGCAFGALGEPTAQATLRAVAAMGGTPECTIIGSGARTSIANAVLANGVLIRTLDVNDFGSEPRTSGHPSDNIAVALAAGEQSGCSGRDVLAAIVLGYELHNR